MKTSYTSYLRNVIITQKVNNMPNVSKFYYNVKHKKIPKRAGIKYHTYTMLLILFFIKITCHNNNHKRNTENISSLNIIY